MIGANWSFANWNEMKLRKSMRNEIVGFVIVWFPQIQQNANWPGNCWFCEFVGLCIRMAIHFGNIHCRNCPQSKYELKTNQTKHGLAAMQWPCGSITAAATIAEAIGSGCQAQAARRAQSKTHPIQIKPTHFFVCCQFVECLLFRIANLLFGCSNQTQIEQLLQQFNKWPNKKRKVKMNL